MAFLAQRERELGSGKQRLAVAPSFFQVAKHGEPGSVPGFSERPFLSYSD